MDNSQLATFKQFWKDNIGVRFGFYHPRTKELLQVRFIGTPSYDALSHLLTRVSITLEVMP